MQLAITVTYKTSILITWLHGPIKACKIDCQLVEQRKSSVVQDIKFPLHCLYWSVIYLAICNPGMHAKYWLGYSNMIIKNYTIKNHAWQMRQATDYIKLTCHYGLVCRSRLYTILSNSLLTCEELKGSYKKSVYPSPVSVIASSIKIENIFTMI